MTIWEKMVDKAKDIDAWRKFHMSFAEWLDAWRIAPRVVLVCYGYLIWILVDWYIHLESKMIPGCDVEKLAEACIYHAPNTQHAALITIVVGISAGVFGLYTSTGKNWANGIKLWNPENIAETKRALSPPIIGGRRASDKMARQERPEKPDRPDKPEEKDFSRE